MVGLAVISWTIWKIRNSACFDNKKIDDPRVVVNLVGYWLNSWSIMQTKQANREALSWGVKLFEQIASENLQASHGWHPGRRTIAAS